MTFEHETSFITSGLRSLCSLLRTSFPPGSRLTVCMKILEKRIYPLFLHRLYLNHGFILYFRQIEQKFKEYLSKVLNTFENIIENEAFAQRSKCSIFHNI